MNMGKKGDSKLKDRLISLQKKFIVENAKSKDDNFGSKIMKLLFSDFD